MKRFYLLVILLFNCCTWLYAQTNDLQLARQYAENGEQQKALDIYQKLYKQDNEVYFQQYLNALTNFKKYDEAEAITKKILRKHPNSSEYLVALGNIYT